MSEYTSNLQLFKYDTATDGKEVFSINASMNDNWDKIDAFAARIKSLSNLDEQGEKRFTDINAELNKKLEAEVLLAENGYIKFNNGVLVCFGFVWASVESSVWETTYALTFPNEVFASVVSQANTGNAGFHTVSGSHINLSTIQIRYQPNGRPTLCYVSIGH